MSAKLIAVRTPEQAEAAVVVLHGGGSRTQGVKVSPAQLSVLRMIPIARRVARTGRGRLAVFRLLNSTRGWDTHHTPVDDVAWAIGQVSDRLGRELPLGLVGHSLGGRAAILSSDQPAVTSVVALNPYVYPEDGDVDASGVRMLMVQGTLDRIASPEKSATVATRLRRTARSLSYVRVEGGKHAMLRRHGVFSSLAAQFAAATLLDPAPDRPAEAVGQLADEQVR